MRRITIIWRGYRDRMLRGALAVAAFVLCLTAYFSPSETLIEACIAFVPIAFCLSRRIKHGPVHVSEGRFLLRINDRIFNPRGRHVKKLIESGQLVLDHNVGERFVVELPRHPATLISPVFIGKVLTAIGLGLGKVAAPIGAGMRGLVAFARINKLTAFISVLLFAGAVFGAFAVIYTMFSTMWHYRYPLLWITIGVLLVGATIWYRYWQLQVTLLTTHHVVVFGGPSGVPYKLPLPTNPEYVRLEQTNVSKAFAMIRLSVVPWYKVTVAYSPGPGQNSVVLMLNGICAAEALKQMGHFTAKPRHWREVPGTEVR